MLHFKFALAVHQVAEHPRSIHRFMLHEGGRFRCARTRCCGLVWDRFEAGAAIGPDGTVMAGCGVARQLSMDPHHLLKEAHCSN